MSLHHPYDDTLARLAAGGLGAGPSFVVAVHLAGCRECRARVALFEATGGALHGGGAGGDRADRHVRRNSAPHRADGRARAGAGRRALAARGFGDAALAALRRRPAMAAR